MKHPCQAFWLLHLTTPHMISDEASTEVWATCTRLCSSLSCHVRPPGRFTLTLPPACCRCWHWRRLPRSHQHIINRRAVVRLCCQHCRNQALQGCTARRVRPRLSGNSFVVDLCNRIAGQNLHAAMLQGQCLDADDASTSTSAAAQHPSTEFPAFGIGSSLIANIKVLRAAALLLFNTALC